MGIGDNLMASGLARGAAARGKRIAFGDGRRIIWDHNSPLILGNNPNVAPPGSEGAKDLEWVRFHKGNRVYNTAGNNRWIWNYDFRPVPGEVFLTAAEREWAECVPRGGVIIEPDLPPKPVAANKRWPRERFAAVAERLIRDGYRVVQFAPDATRRPLCRGVKMIKTPTFRHALAAQARAALYIGPEGGLHHGAAAMGIPAVVLFGGFIPPTVTGYPTHINLTGGATEFCGLWTPCVHCRRAMEAITVEEVVEAARAKLAAAPECQ